MQNNLANPYQKYKEQSVMTMTCGEMLTQLFDEAIKQLSGALVYLENKDYPAVNNSLLKFQKIIGFLKSSLNYQYEVSSSLDSMYEYFIHRIIQANVKKDSEPINEIIPMIIELKEAFITVERSTRMARN